jgi:hypothetical protein
LGSGNRCIKHLTQQVARVNGCGLRRGAESISGTGCGCRIALRHGQAFKEDQNTNLYKKFASSPYFICATSYQK